MPIVFSHSIQPFGAMPELNDQQLFLFFYCDNNTSDDKEYDSFSWLRRRSNWKWAPTRSCVLTTHDRTAQWKNIYHNFLVALSFLFQLLWSSFIFNWEKMSNERIETNISNRLHQPWNLFEWIECVIFLFTFANGFICCAVLKSNKNIFVITMLYACVLYVVVVVVGYEI